MKDRQPSTSIAESIAESDLRAVSLALEPDGRLVQVEPLTGGSSANVVRLDIERSSGELRSVVFRQHRSPEFKGDQASVTRMEFELLHELHRQGLAVAEPLLLDDSATLTDPYLVTDWVEGSTGVSESELPEALDQMAQFLAALHSVVPRQLMIPGLDAIEDPMVGALRYLPDTELGDAARRALSTVEHLAENEPVVLHGDYWPGNVLWHRGQLAAVLDWEDACIGDPLVDLATARVELLCQFGAEAAELFTRSYLKRPRIPLQTDALRIWEVYVSATALSSMHTWGLDPEVEADRRALTERFLTDAVERLGAVSWS